MDPIEYARLSQGDEDIPKNLRLAMKHHLRHTGAKNFIERGPTSAMKGAYGTGVCYVLRLLAEERGDELHELLEWWKRSLGEEGSELSREVLRSLKRMKK